MNDNAPGAADAPSSPPQWTEGPQGRLAYRFIPGAGPTIVWLGGYASDMLGTKAEALASYAAKARQSFLRFDYSGHGESEGRFEDGTISRWTADAEAVIEHAAPGPKVLIGSSMGAWITLLLAQKMRDALRGIILIAPAPDFTQRLVLPRFTAEQRQRLDRDGVVYTGTSGHPAETYTKALFTDGADHLLMDEPIALPVPVAILHGMSDDVVPTSHVLALADVLDAPDVAVTLVKGGDHRLSSEADLQRLTQTVDAMVHRPNSPS